MRIFITGVTGFIGSYLAESLLDDGHVVAGLIRQTNRLNTHVFRNLVGRLECHYGSLTDYQSVRLAIREFQPEAILHLGAITPVAYSFDHPHEVTQTNYLGTINLAEASLRETPTLKKFVFASTMETYGFQDKRDPFVETDESRPACPYAVAKVASEKYLQYLHYAHGFPATMIRQTNAYGRRENDYFVVEAILTQMLKGGPVNLGDPRPVRNFLFITDLMAMYKALLVSGESTHGQVYNTGPDNGVTIETLAEMCREETGYDGRINWYTRPKRPGEIFYLNSSCAKASAGLGWRPTVSLRDGLKRTADIWRENLSA